MKRIAALDLRPVAIFCDEGLAVLGLTIEIARTAQILGDVDLDPQGVVRPGRDDEMLGSHAEQDLVEPNARSYNFDTIDGVTYEIDVTQPSRYDIDGKLVHPESHRIMGLSYQGKPIDAAAPFLVVTNNYRANGGGHFPGLDASRIVNATPTETRQALADYLAHLGKVEVKADGKTYVWHRWADILSPRPGTEVLATYANHYYAGKAAATTRKLGKGSVSTWNSKPVIIGLALAMADWTSGNCNDALWLAASVQTSVIHTASLSPGSLATM